MLAGFGLVPGAEKNYFSASNNFLEHHRCLKNRSIPENFFFDLFLDEGEYISHFFLTAVFAQSFKQIVCENAIVSSVSIPMRLDRPYWRRESIDRESTLMLLGLKSNSRLSAFAPAIAPPWQTSNKSSVRSAWRTSLMPMVSHCMGMPLKTRFSFVPSYVTMKLAFTSFSGALPWLDK